MGILSTADLCRIESYAYLGFLDKHLVIEEFDCSEKTVDRIFEKLGILHKKSTLIEMLRLYYSGVSSKEISRMFKCSVVNVNALVRRSLAADTRVLKDSQAAGRRDTDRVYSSIEARFAAVESRRRYTNPTSSSSRTKYSINEEYFDTINTEHKAYFLGLFLADGHLGRDNRSFNISSIDKDVIEKFLFYSKATYPLHERIASNTSFKSTKPVFRADIYNPRFVQPLINMGISSDKTLKCLFPTNHIPSIFLKDFIRGYLDGDGSFSKCRSFREKQNKIEDKYMLSFEGTIEFLDTLKWVLEQECLHTPGGSFRKRHKTENCCWTLRYSGKNMVSKILKYVYVNAQIYMNRKYIKFHSLNLE